MDKLSHGDGCMDRRTDVSNDNTPSALIIIVMIMIIIIAYLYSANFTCVSRYDGQRGFIAFIMDWSRNYTYKLSECVVEHVSFKSGLERVNRWFEGKNCKSNNWVARYFEGGRCGEVGGGAHITSLQWTYTSRNILFSGPTVISYQCVTFNVYTTAHRYVKTPL